MKAFEDLWRLYLAQQFGTTDGAEEETVEKATADPHGPLGRSIKGECR